jgi:hypothetical protein
MLQSIYYQRFFGLVPPERITLAALPFTHRYLMQIDARSTSDAYRLMQAHNWSSNQRWAKEKIKSLHLSHMSMSIGDIVHDVGGGGGFWVVDHGFDWRVLETDFSDNRPQPFVWMSTEVKFINDRPEIMRIKVATDVNCLPPDAYTVERIGYVSYNDLMPIVTLIEDNWDWQVCLDFGNQFYESKIGA